MKYYAGIGSRETPANVQKQMAEIAEKLCNLGYTLRSGGAGGADAAFESGAAKKKIYLPWDGFNGRYEDGNQYVVPPFEKPLVEKFHPKPKSLSEFGWKFMSRNSYQVLGDDLKTPVDFVICWTSNGDIKGGTGQAMRIAKHYKIPIFNLYHGTSEFSDYIIRNVHLGY